MAGAEIVDGEADTARPDPRRERDQRATVERFELGDLADEIAGIEFDLVQPLFHVIDMGERGVERAMGMRPEIEEQLQAGNAVVVIVAQVKCPADALGTQTFPGRNRAEELDWTDWLTVAKRPCKPFGSERNQPVCFEPVDGLVRALQQERTEQPAFDSDLVDHERAAGRADADLGRGSCTHHGLSSRRFLFRR